MHDSLHVDFDATIPEEMTHGAEVEERWRIAWNEHAERMLSRRTQFDAALSD